MFAARQASLGTLTYAGLPCGLQFLADAFFALYLTKKTVDSSLTPLKRLQLNWRPI
jgi:hypothetical protein